MYDKQKYIPQVDINAAKGKFEANKVRWREHLAKTYSKKAAKTIASSALNQVAANSAAPVFGIPSAIKTKQHINRLKELQAYQPYPCTCHQIEGVLSCEEIMDYVLTKKQGKLYHKSVASVPGASTLESLRAAFKGAYKRYKGTKGERREKFAHILFNKARNGSHEQTACLYCQAIVAELLGNYTKQASWEKLFAILDWDQGWKLIFEKLAST